MRNSFEGQSLCLGRIGPGESVGDGDGVAISIVVFVVVMVNAVDTTSVVITVAAHGMPFKPALHWFP